MDTVPDLQVGNGLGSFVGPGWSLLGTDRMGGSQRRCDTVDALGCPAHRPSEGHQLPDPRQPGGRIGQDLRLIDNSWGASGLRRGHRAVPSVCRLARLVSGPESPPQRAWHRPCPWDAGALGPIRPGCRTGFVPRLDALPLHSRITVGGRQVRASPIARSHRRQRAPTTTRAFSKTSCKTVFRSMLAVTRGLASHILGRRSRSASTFPCISLCRSSVHQPFQ